jgi:hypothetical protein
LLVLSPYGQMTAHCQSGEVHDHFCRSTNVDDIAHKGEIDFVHEVAYEAKLAKLQELM